MSYPKIIKEAALEKMFHTDLSLRHISDELGIPRATLHGWKRQYQLINNDNETIHTPAESWTPEEKFAVVLESATLSEVELNAYCREKGLYPGQIKAWREASILRKYYLHQISDYLELFANNKSRAVSIIVATIGCETRRSTEMA